MSTINVNTISPQSGSNLSVTSTKFTGSLLSTASFGRVQATTLGGNSPIEIDGEITGTISGSITSTASFGTYIGDGGQLSGIETLQRTGSDEVSGSARVFGPTSLTGSLIVSGSNIEYTNKLSGSLTSTASFAHLQTAGNIVFSGSKHEMNGELNLHGGSDNKFVVKALYGDGSLNADFTFRNPQSGANDGALGIRGYYLGANGKILTLGANTGDEYWSFTSTAFSGSTTSISKLGHISASGNIHMTGTGSFSASLESTSSVGSFIIDGTVNPLSSNATASFRSQRYIGEVGGPARDVFVFTGNGGVYSDRRIGISGTGVGIEYGAAHQLRAHYLSTDSKILSISDFSNDYWFFTSTYMSASHMSTVKLHSITASGDINMTGTGSLTGVKNIVATGDIRAEGDVIAKNLIVSSSITHMTTSFSSGSTKFGDSNDDTHTFTGSLIQSGGMNVFASASFFGHDNTAAGWASVNAETGMLNVSMSKDGADTSHGIVIRHHYNETGTAYPLLIQNVGGTNKAYIDYTGGFNGDKISFDMAGFKGSIDGDSGNNGNMNFVANSRGFTFKSEGKTLLDMTGTGGGSTLDIQSNTTIKDDLLVTGSISIASGSITGSSSSTGSFGDLRVASGSIKAHLIGVGQQNTSATAGIVVENKTLEFRQPTGNDGGTGIVFSEAVLGDNSFRILHNGAGSAASNTLKFYATNFHATNPYMEIFRDGKIVISEHITGDAAFISGSLTSTGSFGKLFGDASSLTNLPGGGIFANSSSFQGTENDLQITGSVDITGSFSATAKSFIIRHPAKDQGFLQHGSLEGPEHGVYVRGHLNDNDQIMLPDYWDSLVDETTISVQLTPIGTWQQLFVKEVSNSKVVVQNRLDGHAINCYYVVQGERKDIPKIELEL